MAILKDLIVHGSSRFLNKIYANEIQAEEGIFSKLIAKNADITDLTVYGLLDSRGQLHTKTWTNSNIATIDGSFYITPTLNSASGTFSFLNSTSTNARFIGDFSVMNSSSMYLGGKSPTTSSWTANSKVLITGQVKVNNEWIPLGNVVADISSVNSTTLDIKNIRTTINGNTAPSTTSMIYFVKPNQTLSYRNLKISLCEIYRNSAFNPLGIYITSSGLNGKTFLDIYGGVEATSTAGNSGGLAKPNVRIGNLSGIPSFTISGGDTVSPSGWGIFTTNGYFEGAIVSDVGNIGGWNIRTDGIYNGIKGITTSGTTTGTFIGIGGISNYQDSSTYVNIQEGVITAKGANFLTATIGDATHKMTIGNGTSSSESAIKYGMTGLSDTTHDGFYIGTDGIALGKGAFKVTKEGALTASNVDLTGKITATSGSIGGWTINSSYGIYTNSKTSATSTNAGILIQKDGGIYAGAYNSTNAACPFQVTSAGTITATSGKIGGWSIGENSIFNNTNSMTSTSVGTFIGQAGFRNYKNTNTFVNIKDGVIEAKGANISGSIIATSFSAYDSNNKERATVNTNGLIVKDASGNTVASLSNNLTIGQVAADKYNVYVDATNGIDIRNNTASLANFGSSVRIGKTGQTRAEIDFHSLQLKDKEGTPYLYVSDLRNASGVAENVQESFIGNGTNRYFNLFGGSGIQSISSITIDGTATSAYTRNNPDQIVFNSAPADGAEIVVTYTTTSPRAKVYTFGQRLSDTNVKGLYSYAEGYNTTASGTVSHAEGWGITASGRVSHAEGNNTTASGSYSHAEGSDTTASGSYSHAEGYHTTASRSYSHAEGNNTTASGLSSHAEGLNTIASHSYSHAEGDNSKAKGYGSHAEGFSAEARGNYSHAEGDHTLASGISSHAEGNAIAEGDYSHAEGMAARAEGYCSHAGGYNTIATASYSTVIGKYNANTASVVNGEIVYDAGDYAFIIGNGTDDSYSNAFAVDWDGIPYARRPKNGTNLGDYASMFDLIYPVGSIYMSVNNTSPATLFGGTWEQLKDTFLLAAGTSYSAGSTGGAATVTLTAAQSGVPSHAHTYTRPTVASSGAVTNGITSSGAHTHTITTYYSKDTASGNAKNRPQNGGGSTDTQISKIVSASGAHTHNLPNHTHTLTGGGVANNTAANASEAHNNMPPYLTVYMWKRTG